LKELGEFEQSIQRYIEIQQQFQEDPVAFNGQVSTLKAAGRFREALDLSFRNAKRFQLDPVIRQVLGGCLATVGKLDEAVKQYRRAFELDASDPHVRISYAYALRSAGRYREAIELLEAAHATGPRQAVIANSKANILRTIGELDRALTIYLGVISKFPSFIPAKFGAAAVRILLNQVDDAVQDLPCDNMESELDWIGFRTYALSFISRDAAGAAVERLKWGIANCPWRVERIRMETALGFAQIKAKNPESIVTLQHNLDRLEDRVKQSRLLFLGVAQAEAGDRFLANMILTRIFSSKDRQLRSLNSAIIDFYNPRSAAPPVDPALIYRQQMNLAMAA
jgi:tetratricopeptide (TPR) repeat protein